MEAVAASLGDLERSQQALDEKVADALATLDATFARLDDSVRSHRSQTQEFSSLQRAVRDLESRVAETQDKEQLAALDRFKSRLEALQARLDKMSAIKPRTGSVLLMYVLGKVNMKVWKQSEIVQMKSEYNNFKRATTPIFILLPLIQILMVDLLAFDLMGGWFRIVAVANQVWLLYYYSAMALRENILQVNGSNIQDWWLYHHYLSIVLAALIILWPDGAPLRFFLHISSYMLVYQGFVTVLQNNYQDRRHYVRTTMGKATDIDPSSSETLLEKPSDLKLLIPLLYLLYILELGLGIHVFANVTFNTDLGSGQRTHSFFVSSLILSLGVGNTLTTSKVVLQKPYLKKNKKQ